MARCLEHVADHRRVRVRDPDRGEDDREGLVLPSRVCAATWAASSRCGRPPTEKIGSFWPRTSVARPSIDGDPGEDRIAGCRRGTRG